MDEGMDDAMREKVRQVIQEFIKTIGDGCRSVGDYENRYATLSKEAIAFFVRRYKLSIKKKLKDSPKDWPNNTALSAAYAHGQIAGSMWLFWQKADPSAHVDVDVLLFNKAAHVMELECSDYLLKNSAGATLDAARAEQSILGGYCW